MRNHRPVKWIMSRDGSRRSVLEGQRTLFEDGNTDCMTHATAPSISGWSSGVNKE